jgi:multidrug efflux pump subunit AcrA (membrane-fusion protein)
MSRGEASNMCDEEVVSKSSAIISVKPVRWIRRLALILAVVIVCIAFGLIVIPWQQSVTGTGRVIIYNAMQRPQTIEAQIPGRHVKWNVQEGSHVRKGELIATLEDIEQRFLDAGQVARLQSQRATLINRRSAAEKRAGALRAQQSALRDSRDAAVPAAGERAKQAYDRLRAARQALEGARQVERAARLASVPVADEKLRQADERRMAAEQAVTIAKQQVVTAQVQRDRVKLLFEKDLRSKRDDELAELDLVRAQTELRRAENALEIAKRDTNVSGFDQMRADVEVSRAMVEVERAEAAVDLARRDTTIGTLDRSKFQADATAAVNAVEASLQSAQETIEGIANDLLKLEVELQNLRERRDQRMVRAPSDGRIVRLLKGGRGEIVKAGDVLAVLAPDSIDQAVELMLEGSDAPLVQVGRKVRLQFSGWPALQFSGWPSVAVGTFGGVVSVIDAIDDGSGKYRIIVKPDKTTVAEGKDEPWPPLNLLRPGARAIGWVMLDRVPLGWEVWRRTNAFPPTVDPAGKPSDEKSAANVGLSSDASNQGNNRKSK